MSKASDTDCIILATAEFVVGMTGDYVLKEPGRNCDRCVVDRYFSRAVRRGLELVGALHRCSKKMYVPVVGQNRGKRIYYALPLIRHICKECGVRESDVIVGISPLKS